MEQDGENRNEGIEPDMNDGDEGMKEEGGKTIRELLESGGSAETNENTDRYDDPFIRLLELYVLKAVGALEKEDAERMKKLTPELQKVFGVSGSWIRIVEQVMEYPKDAPEEIRLIWTERKQEVAQTEGRRLHPEEFARDFADISFEDDDDE